MIRKSYFVSFLFFLAACGSKPIAEKQPHGVVSAPEYAPASERPLGLFGGKSILTYDGSLIIWASETSAQEIRPVMRSSREGREVKAQALNHLSKDVLTASKAVDISRRSLSGAEEALAQYDQASGGQSNLREAKLAKAEVLVSGWISEKAGPALNSADKRRVEALWHAYCDSKLWELAVSEQLKLNFAVRPSPSGLCEGYYAGKYFTSEICQPSPEGRNYFDCIWRDGVLKSDILTVNLRGASCKAGDESAPIVGATLALWLDGEKSLMREVLHGVDEASSRSLANVIMSGDIIPRSLGRLYKPLADCRLAFARPSSPSLPTTSEGVLAELEGIREESPNSLLMLGNSSSGLRGKLPLLPTSDQSEGVVRLVRAFDVRMPLEGIGSVSYSDGLFNQPIGSKPYSLPEQRVREVEGQPEFASILNAGDSPRRQEIKKGLSEAQGALATAVAKLAEAQRFYRQIARSKVDGNRLDSIAAVQAPRATSYFNSFQLVTEQDGDEVSVALEFSKPAERASGCVKAGGIPCVGTQSLRGAGDIPLTLELDQTSSKLILKLSLDRPELRGFHVLARREGGVQFNDLSEQDLQGKILEIKFYFNTLSSILPFFTGEARVFDQVGNEVYLGAVSGDAFFQVEKTINSDISGVRVTE